ncbi:MAG: diguanylate cyclase [Lachnospiraceae bacterium]|nr:diguanylate cyclase [Lachnospiraceae bacterium]
MAFRGYRDAIKHRYRVHLKGIIDLVDTQMDRDDLYNCIKTGVKSEKYEELRLFLDDIVDTLDVLYVYIMIPQNETGYDSQMYVMESHSSEEYADNRYRDMFLLYSGSEFPEQASRNFMEAYNSDEISYFDSRSSWGRQFNATMPIFTENGERFAIICAEINYDVILTMAFRYLVLTVAVFVLLGLIALFMFYKWIERKITVPISRLEESAVEFANKLETGENLDIIVFHDPDLRTENELDSLAFSIKRMAQSVRGYVKDLIKANEEASNAKLETKEMTKLVYKDPLTRVYNKAAYLEEKILLTNEIEQKIAKFALIMIDVNDLKKVNDGFGHEHGDEYIVGTCEIICDTFVHSSVYRIGGDEFIVVLRDRDYANRDQLIAAMTERFNECSKDNNLKPWKRFNASCGMAVYSDGKSVDDIFQEADADMYRHKQEYKLNS